VGILVRGVAGQKVEHQVGDGLGDWRELALRDGGEVTGCCPCRAVPELEAEDGVDLMWVEWRRRGMRWLPREDGPTVGGGGLREETTGRFPCRAVPELEEEDGVDLIREEWSRRGDAVAAEGGRRWEEAD
jgi:hypothetical protein